MMTLNQTIRKCTGRYNSVNRWKRSTTGRHQTFCQTRKSIGILNTNGENIQSRCRIGIWQRKLHHTSNEKWQTTHKGRS